MLVTKKNCHHKQSVTLNNLIEYKSFRVYYDSDILFACIEHEFGDYFVKIIEKNILLPINWKNNILYFQEEPLIISNDDDTIMDPTPKWWPDEITWPPSLKSFLNITHDLNDIMESRHNSLRQNNNWYDIFTLCNFKKEYYNCACNCKCPTFSTSCFVLKNEYGIPTYKLAGRYEHLFKISEEGYNYKKFSSFSRDFIRHILKAFYIDQACLWRKIIALELRNKKIKLKSLWLRCCVYYINREINECLTFIEYHEYKRYNICQTKGEKIRNLLQNY